MGDRDRWPIGVDVAVQLPAGLLVTAGAGLVNYQAEGGVLGWAVLGAVLLILLGVYGGYLLFAWVNGDRLASAYDEQEPPPRRRPRHSGHRHLSREGSSSGSDRSSSRRSTTASGVPDGKYLGSGGVRLPPKPAGGHGTCRYYAVIADDLCPIGIYCGWAALCKALHPKLPRGHRGKYIGTYDLEDAVAFFTKKIGSHQVKIFLW